MKYLSWKTTAAGIGMIATAIFTMILPALTTSQIVAVAAILAGIGLIFARDDDKTSEEVGAKVGEKQRPDGK